MRIMASLIMSAAVPWMGVLMAARSALPRMVLVGGVEVRETNGGGR
jgi:hypothetical protein